jgi:hypothetical protein
MDGHDRRARHLNSATSTFLLGQDSRGHWIVQDTQHLCGGIFLRRAEAPKFAMFEPGGQPRAVIFVPGILELDMSDVTERKVA